MNRRRQAIKGCLSTFLPRRALLISGKCGSRAVALTFDDGPHPEHTAAVLDELQRLDLRATFFVVGHHAARHPELVQRMFAEGHCVGHHSWFHTEPAATTAEELLTEVDACRELLERTLGINANFFRPPKGKLSIAKALGLWYRSQTIVLWNVDSKDFAMTSVSQARQWCDEYQPIAGDIVLLHDNCPFAVEMIEPIADRARPGLHFDTIADWVPRRNPTLLAASQERIVA